MEVFLNGCMGPLILEIHIIPKGVLFNKEKIPGGGGLFNTENIPGRGGGGGCEIRRRKSEHVPVLAFSTPSRIYVKSHHLIAFLNVFNYLVDTFLLPTCFY